MPVVFDIALATLLFTATENIEAVAPDSPVLSIRELQIDVALGRARARTLSRARRDAFGRLLLMRRNFRLRALSDLSKSQGYILD